MKRSKGQILSNKGFTLIELLIAMMVFIIVLVIASEAFNKIITQSAKFSKMEETNIEGVIGLEMMRHDLEQMGFGLPWGWVSRDTSVTEGPQLVNSGFKYAESTDTFGQDLNDAPNNVPRAFVGLAPKGNFTAAYFGVKGTTAGRSKASQRWTYIPYMNYSAVGFRESRPVSFASNNPDASSPYDKVIIINSSPNHSEFDRQLVVEPGSSNTSSTISSFAINYRNDGNIVADYLPTSSGSTYLVYGLLDKGTTQDPRMPFNRTDFFIDNNNVPTFCAPGTGVLYKASVIHGSSTGGGYDKMPLLDCVADMQVVLGWDISTSNPQAGSISAYSSLPAVNGGAVSVATTSAADPTAIPLASSNIQTWLADPKGLREHLKIVKVYILAQEGKRDPSYSASMTTIEVGDQVSNGGLSPKSTYTLSEAQKQYRWKLYRIVTRPRNLFSNSY